VQNLRRISSTSVMMSLLFSTNISANTLKETVAEALNTNPIVAERLSNYRATQQDLNVAKSEYLPTLDLRASAGYSQAGNIKSDVANVDYSTYQSSLVLTQNLFRGFSTENKVDYQNARILAAAYNYVEKANDVAFDTTMAYFNVLKAHGLVDVAKQNVESNEELYAKVKQLSDAGLTTESEVQKFNHLCLCLNQT